MAAMHSEILLVSSKERRLYSWACAGDSAPQPHPLTEELGLEGERVGVVDASDIRATVITESGKVATFYDSLLRSTCLLAYICFLLWVMVCCVCVFFVVGSL